MTSALGRRLLPVASGAGTTIVRGQRSLVNLASNNYLGLATDSRIIDAAKRAIDEFGTSATASSLVVGYSTLHAQLAERIAQLKGSETAVILPTGFAACIAALTSLIEPQDLIFADALNHASLIDGCRLTGARTRHFTIAIWEDWVFCSIDRDRNGGVSS